MRTSLRTASLRTSASTTLSVETPVETCRWKLRFYKVQKVRFRCYSGCYSALQQMPVSLDTSVDTLPKPCRSRVTDSKNSARVLR